MRWIGILLLMLVATPAHAAERAALTASFRGMVGASVRLDHPISKRVTLLEEIGASAWVVYGDDPTRQQGSPVLLRPHVKLGLDVMSNGGNGRWYGGPRIVGGWFFPLTATPTSAQAEVGLMATVGRKWDWGKMRFQVGGGLGGHYLMAWRDGNDLFLPMPHAELRIGRVL